MAGDTATHTFSTTIAADGKRVVVPIPFDPDALWGAKRQHRVGGTIDGKRVRAVIEHDGTAWAFALAPSMRRDCGIDVGDEVTVTLTPEGPQQSDLAPDVKAALDAEPEAAEFFASLAQFYRKAYLKWIDSTKKSPDERVRRIAEVVRLCKARVKERPR